MTGQWVRFDLVEKNVSICWCHGVNSTIVPQCCSSAGTKVVTSLHTTQQWSLCSQQMWVQHRKWTPPTSLLTGMPIVGLFKSYLHLLTLYWYQTLAEFWAGVGWLLRDVEEIIKIRLQYWGRTRSISLVSIIVFWQFLSISNAHVQL